MSKEKDYSKVNEWELACQHMDALQREDYNTCNAIQKEVDNRIKANTINHQLMQGFRYYNPNTEKFEGQPHFNGMNDLFKNYKYQLI
jgi:hypothetical protein